MGRLLVVVELPILSHLGSIARNGAGLSQSNVAIDCAEDHINDQMPPQSIYIEVQHHNDTRACPVARPERLRPFFSSTMELLGTPDISKMIC